MTYRANVVRYLDSQNNKSLIQFNEEYDSTGILKEITFSFIGVGSSSGKAEDNIYNFDNVTINNKPFTLKDGSNGTKEDLKNYLLNYFNKNQKLKLICPKESCNDPNCKPHLSIGNKITQTENTKKPYFASNCDGINYGESQEHLNAKINIHKLLMEKCIYFAKSKTKTQIQNIELEKTFSYGNGQERRADVYYEKVYETKTGLVTEKYAIEVQRSNIKYDELTERTEWYKNNDIATLWIVVSDIFNSDSATINILSKNDFNLPLLSLVSFSMKNYNDRFFVYDSNIKKIIPLTVQQENLTIFNELEPEEQKKVKSKFSTDNLCIISNQKIDDKNYQLLSYKSNRNNKNIGVDLLNFGIFNKDKKIYQKLWNNDKKSFEYVHFLKIGNSLNQEPTKKYKM